MQPKSLGIIYCFPSSLNSQQNQWDLDKVAQDIGQRDIFILGAGMQNIFHIDHNNTKVILDNTAVANTEFFGYITMLDSIATIKSQIDDWQAMHTKISGIFCSNAGYDFGIDRAKQNEIVDYIHNKTLKVFMNAWVIDDVLENHLDAVYNPSGVPHHLTTGDWYLSESFQIKLGEYEPVSVWETKSDKMSSLRTTTGVNMACVTTSDGRPYDQQQMDYAYYSAAIHGFDAIGWGEQDYAATTAVAPYRSRKQILGGTFVGPIIETNGVYERQTNIGIHIDTNNFTVSLITKN